MALAIFGITAMNSCSKKNNDNDDATNLLTLYALTQMNNSNSSKVISTLQNSGSTIANGVNSSVSGLSTGNNKQPLASAKSLMVKARQAALKRILNRDTAMAIPTASSITYDSGTCTYDGGTFTTTCSAVITGTVDCNPSGTAALTSVNYNMTVTGGSIDGSTKGDVSFDKCVVRGVDWANFPGQIVSSLTGDVTFDNQTTMNMSFVGTPTPSSMTMNITFKDNSKISSAGLKVDDSSSVKVDLDSKVNLSVNTVITNNNFSQTAESIKLSADYNDTLTGTYDVTGTVGSKNADISKTYNNDVFKYHIDCEFLISNNTSSCTVTDL